ncbi:MAG: DUF1116 domain-containing protein [Variovorax sp.]
MDHTFGGMSTVPTSIEEANARAVGRVVAVRPELVGLERASDCLGLTDFELLHAGPALQDPRVPCIPLRNAAMAAALFEGWAQNPQQAQDLIADGRLRLRPAQDVGCVVPLADVVSPSMWIQIVRDANDQARWAGSPINGGSTSPMRVGICDVAVVRQLHWLNTVFAPAYRIALSGGPIATIDVADQALCAGDDCHGKTAAATKVLSTLLEPRFSGVDASACRTFLMHSAGFFLNIWMASARCMLSAAAGVGGSDIVTCAAGNGQAFGLQVAGLPDRWFTSAADAPTIPNATAQQCDASLGAIGDSAIVDLLGFGAMTTCGSAPRDKPAFSTLWPDLADVPASLLHAQHPAFTRSQARILVSAAQAAQAQRQPIVSLGVLDKAGVQGRLEGGFYRVPERLFAEANAALYR